MLGLEGTRMSKHEIVEGYLNGAISRRTFVRRLTAAGLSLSAALSYAELLRANSAHAASRGNDFYGGDYYDGDGDYYGPGDYYEEPDGPPGVQTENPTNIEQTSAIAQALIDPNGGATDFRFEYRPVGSLGSLKTEVGGILGGDEYTPASALLSGLQPGTRYEYRAVARNSAGRTKGNAIRFTTATAGQSGSGGTGQGSSGGPVAAMAASASTLSTLPPLATAGAGSGPGAPRIRLGKLSSLHTLQSGHVLSVPVTVDQDATVVVSAIKGIRHAKKSAAKPGLVRIASLGRGTVKAGTQRRFKVRLNRYGRRVLKDRKSVSVLIEVHAINRAGLEGILRTTVRFTR